MFIFLFKSLKCWVISHSSTFNPEEKIFLHLSLSTNFPFRWTLPTRWGSSPASPCSQSSSRDSGWRGSSHNIWDLRKRNWTRSTLSSGWTSWTAFASERSTWPSELSPSFWHLRSETFSEKVFAIGSRCSDVWATSVPSSGAACWPSTESSTSKLKIGSSTKQEKSGSYIFSWLSVFSSISP